MGIGDNCIVNMRLGVGTCGFIIKILVNIALQISLVFTSGRGQSQNSFNPFTKPVMQ